LRKSNASNHSVGPQKKPMGMMLSKEYDVAFEDIKPFYIGAIWHVWFALAD
jgi:hypothetical protein